MVGWFEVWWGRGLSGLWIYLGWDVFDETLDG